MSKKKERRIERIRRMLEFYTMVPPFPGMTRKKNKNHNRKASKISGKR